MPITLSAKIGLLALAIAATGCASKASDSQRSEAAESEPVAQFQEPSQVPREKWSDAMIILHDDMGIVGQRDIPLEQVNNQAFIAAQRNARINGGVIPAGGATLAATGYAAPPTGFSAGGAAGMSLALGFLTTPPASGPAQRGQIAAWVPATSAASMEEAIEIATRAYKKARITAFAKVGDLDLPASRYPLGSSPSKMYPRFVDVVSNNPVRPAGGPVDAPSFLPEGKYYGPIFFARHDVQMRVDETRNGLDEPATAAALSSALPEWFAVYTAGRPMVRGSKGEPPAIYNRGEAYYFVSK